jgi:(1->4)-alpha-D-glucan 1-alpha-D-glucosylmutase
MTTGASLISSDRVPRATYRMQFHKGFTLRHAKDLVPFLHEVGVSHLYASPLLKAVTGSMHGYDVCDFSRLNPELGTEDDLRALVAALRQRNMGLVLDIVPNHMAASGENFWWWEVLLHGPSGQFANYFDIDWASLDPKLRGKVLLPVLEDEYEKVLTTGGFAVQMERAKPVLRYFEHRFPISLTPQIVRQRLLSEVVRELNASPRALDIVLQQQHYRLTCWRYGDAHLNYRRFFNISSLAAIRMEDPVVFDAAHECVLRWWREGLIDGLRIDHIDGLRDPAGYLNRLRERVPGAWLIVEKILAGHESLPGGWPVQGTTGYDFQNRVGGLFIDPAGETPLTEFYRTFTGEPTEYTTVARDSKRWVLRELLATELNRLNHCLGRAMTSNWHGALLTQQQTREALIEVLTSFPAYRTYVPEQGNLVSDEDQLVISRAVELARQEKADWPAGLLDFIEDLLLLRWEGPDEREFVMRFQLLTGPVMAKGVEDTAFYRFNRFIALNAVGGDPGQFGASPERFHLHCIQDQRRWPQAMLATSTHDSKLGEDVEARLSLLSEIPDQWALAVTRWSKMNARYHSGKIPDRNIEYYYYQILVGAWPLPLDRALTVMEKAAYEAKQHTTWTARQADYDRVLREFVAHTLGDRMFVADLSQFVLRLVEPGYLNSLSQTLLKLTTPGVPDIFQGNVIWDYSLVDPDNRRAVDFDSRELAVAAMRQMNVEQAWRRRSEGYPKLWVIQRTLQFRRRKPELFGASSTYQVLRLHGAKARNAVAFQRGEGVVVIAPRLVVHLAGDWAGTEVALPEGEWRNQFTGETVPGGVRLLVELTKLFPVVLLTRKEDG